MKLKNKIVQAMRVFLLLFFVVSSYLSTAQNIIVKPYLQNNDTTSVTIMWEVDNVGIGEVHYGLTPFEMDSITASTSVLGEGSSRIHTAQLSSLLADTKYYYKIIMDNGEQSQLYKFRTIIEHVNESSTQLIAISDMQRDGSHPDKFREIIEQGIVPIISSEVGPSLNDLEAVLIPGDLVATGGDYSQWKDYFFNPSDSLSPYVPFYPVPGNHEYFGGGLPNFIKYFSLPENGPPTLINECWYKDISNLRIIGLNSNSGSADQNLQLAWLGELLDSTAMTDHIDFVFAQLHHPYKSELWTPGESDFTGMVIDSLEEFTSLSNKPSIHFFGHTHGYSRGQSRDHKHLWINVATAGGAIDNWGEFPNADYEEFVKSQDEYGFVYIDVVAGGEPQFTIKRFSRGDQDVVENNILRDELTVFKNEWIPSTPVNTFPLDGDTLLSNCVTLKASEFLGVADSMQASHWQVAKGGDFIDSLVASNWYQSENFYFEVDLQANDDLTDASFQSLSSDSVYHWRVRYRDQNLEWSNWSNPTTFFVENNVDTLTMNLVQNEGAENDIAFWNGDIESLENAECNSVDPYAGSHNFAVGGVCSNESNVGFADQSFDLNPYSAEIAAGTAYIIYGGYMRNFGSSDLPEMYLEFYDGSNLIFTSPTISSATGTWTFKEDLVHIPATSVECKLVLKGTRNAGSDNDSYFDALQLQVATIFNDCPICFGDSGIDVDEDGFCDDLDCDDNDNTVYPGALELCDSKDNNCDGLSDVGNVVTWTGNQGNDLWSDPGNWDQLMVPLACQHVIINVPDSIIINGVFACAGIETVPNTSVTIENGSYLNIDSQDSSNVPASINGTILVNGRWEVR